MGLTYTTNTRMIIPDLNERNHKTYMDANINFLDRQAANGGLCAVPAETPSASLNVVVAAGSFRKGDGSVGTYAGGTQAVSASTTTLIWTTEAGVLTVGTSWPATAHIRIASVLAGGSTITSVTDSRVPLTSIGTSSGYLAKAGDTFGAGANYGFDTTTGTKFGTATNQKLGFWNATAIVQPSGANQAALTDSSGASATGTTLGATTGTAITDSTGGSASGTLAAATNTDALTDSTTGSASTTLASISDTATKNAVASIAAQLVKQRSLNTVLINAIASLAAKHNTATTDDGVIAGNVARNARLLNQIRSDLVAAGLIKGSA